MEEQNKSAKRRERIKTILIIFLAILLLLTFFSNSIMNHSLPTVSAQYAGYGTINEKVRGSGLVTANQKYDVKAEGNRKVSKVLVKVGDEIKAGDDLFVLEASVDDEAIKAAESAIQEAELAYQKALLTAAPDYADKNQEIANARADLQAAINKLNAARASAGSQISAAAYAQASKRASDAQTQLTELGGYLALAQSGELDGIPSQYTSGSRSAQDAFDAASARLAAATAALEEKTAAVTVSSAEQQATVTSLEREAEKADIAYERAKADYEASASDTELKRAMEDAEQTARYAHEDAARAAEELVQIQGKEAEVAAAKEAVAAAQAEADAAKSAKDGSAGSVVQAIRNDMDAAQRTADEAAAIMNAYDAQGETADLATLQEAVTTQERTLSGLISELAKTQKDDQLADQINKLDLKSQEQAIAKQKDELAKLQKDSGSLTIKSKNAGIVSELDCAAGDEVMDGMTLAVVNLTDAGYTVQFTVTGEQARKVKVGTIAEVTNAYYSDITAKLISSRADTDNPSSQDKVLTFDISGEDVTPGQMLALSITCSSASYDCVVPSSAIKSDQDGKFVLIMTSKSTPLGNRYYATRANVTVLASDEINSAVSGDVSYSDFIITTSEKPLTPGMQVRMEE